MLRSAMVDGYVLTMALSDGFILLNGPRFTRATLRLTCSAWLLSHCHLLCSSPFLETYVKRTPYHAPSRCAERKMAVMVAGRAVHPKGTRVHQSLFQMASEKAQTLLQSFFSRLKQNAVGVQRRQISLDVSDGGTLGANGRWVRGPGHWGGGQACASPLGTCNFLH